MNANVPIFSKVSFSCVFSLTQHDVIKSQQVQRYLELVLVEGKRQLHFQLYKPAAIVCKSPAQPGSGCSLAQNPGSSPPSSSCLFTAEYFFLKI